MVLDAHTWWWHNMVGWVSPSVCIGDAMALELYLLMCIVCLSTCNWCMPSQKGKCKWSWESGRHRTAHIGEWGAVAEASKATCIYNAFVCYWITLQVCSETSCLPYLCRYVPEQQMIGVLHWWGKHNSFMNFWFGLAHSDSEPLDQSNGISHELI